METILVNRFKSPFGDGKTQINKLQRGNHKLGIAGTSYADRSLVSFFVRRENPEQMRINFRGHEYTLMLHTTGGKAFWYESDALPMDRYFDVLPFDKFARENPDRVAAHISIDAEMRVNLQLFTRKSATAAWKFSQSIHIAESEITIL